VNTAVWHNYDTISPLNNCILVYSFPFPHLIQKIKNPPRNTGYTVKKLAPYGQTMPNSKSCDIQSMQNIKNLAQSNCTDCIVNGGENSFWKWPDLQIEGLVTLTLTFDRVILHTVVHHSSTPTYKPNFIEIEETFCGSTDVRTHVRTDGHLRPTLLGQLCWRVDLTKWHVFMDHSVFDQSVINIVLHRCGILRWTWHKVQVAKLT